MYHLRNVIGRSNVSADPIRKFNECDDFFKLIVTCYILVAAMKLLGMKSLDDVPSIPNVDSPCDLWMESTETRGAVMKSICNDIVDKYVSFQFHLQPDVSDDKVST